MAFWFEQETEFRIMGEFILRPDDLSGDKLTRLTFLEQVGLIQYLRPVGGMFKPLEPDSSKSIGIIEGAWCLRMQSARPVKVEVIPITRIGQEIATILPPVDSMAVLRRLGEAVHMRAPNFNFNAMREAVVAAHAFLGEYIEAFESRPRPADVVAMRLRKQVDRLTRRESTIIEHRVLRRPPTTLVVLGAQFGVSPKRDQYLQARAEARISIAFGSELPFIAGALKEELRHTADEGAVNRRIDALLPNDLGRRPEVIKRLFRQALITERGLALNPGVSLDECVRE